MNAKTAKTADFAFILSYNIIMDRTEFLNRLNLFL